MLEPTHKNWEKC